MKIKLSSVLAGLVFSHTISAVVIKEEHLYKMHGNMSSSARYFSPISTTSPPASIFPTIAHSFLTVYTDSSFNKVVPIYPFLRVALYVEVLSLKHKISVFQSVHSSIQVYNPIRFKENETHPREHVPRLQSSLQQY
ncbi:hypothetical protein BDF21DRAFT_400109 [Thamnidium elegans]|nr:hypothetical protein BDF21DRAFT_400109 [Thamnidium elegans]